MHHGSGEWQRNLKFVPAIQLDLVFHGNVKTEDCGTCLERKQHRALLCDVPRTAGSIDRKRRVPSAPDFSRHFGEGSKASPGAGTSCRTIPEALNALGDDLAVAVHAGHDNDAAVAPVVSCRKDTAMPKSEDCATSGFIDLVQMRIAFRFPAHSSPHKIDDPVANPADKPNFEAIQLQISSSSFAISWRHFRRRIPFSSTIQNREASARICS